MVRSLQTTTGKGSRAFTGPRDGLMPDRDLNPARWAPSRLLPPC